MKNPTALAIQKKIIFTAIKQQFSLDYPIDTRKMQDVKTSLSVI